MFNFCIKLHKSLDKDFAIVCCSPGHLGLHMKLVNGVHYSLGENIKGVFLPELTTGQDDILSCCRSTSSSQWCHQGDILEQPVIEKHVKL